MPGQSVLLSLSTACIYSASLRTVFRLAAYTGYEGVELVMGPEVWLKGPARVARLARAYGLPILSVHQALLSYSPSGPAAGRMLDATDCALALDCPRVVIHAPKQVHWRDPGAQRWLRTLALCQERVRGSGTRLCLENHGQPTPVAASGPLLLPLSDLMAFAVQHDLALTFDTCHAAAAGVPLLEAWELLAQRVQNIHFSDLNVSPLPPLPYVALFGAHHQMPGEGILPLAELVGRLLAAGYAGPLTMEVGPVALRAWSPTQLPQRLAQIVAYVRQASADRPTEHIPRSAVA